MGKLAGRLKEFAEHLEFLGFTISGETEESFMAKSQNDTTYFFVNPANSIALRMINYSRLDKDICRANRLELLEIINKMNQESILQWSVDENTESKDVTLCTCCYYYGDYVKSSFSNFITLMTSASSNVVSKYIDELKKFG